MSIERKIPAKSCSAMFCWKFFSPLNSGDNFILSSFSLLHPRQCMWVKPYAHFRMISISLLHPCCMIIFFQAEGQALISASLAPLREKNSFASRREALKKLSHAKAQRPPRGTFIKAGKTCFQQKNLFSAYPAPLRENNLLPLRENNLFFLTPSCVSDRDRISIAHQMRYAFQSRTTHKHHRP